MVRRAPLSLVRRASLDDAAAIERIRVETWRSTYRGLLPNDLIDGLRENADRRRERLAAMPAAEFCFVAEDEGSVVGYAMGGPERAGDLEYRSEVYAIYVLPEHQRKGLGRELIRESAGVLADAGFASLLIWVLRENLKGRRFYERLGGHAVRTKPLTEFPGAESYFEVAYGWRDLSALR